MGWNNNGRGYNGYDRRPYGDNRGYNDRGGYNNRNNGYDDRGGYQQQNNLNISVGTRCSLTYNPNKVVCVIRQGREQYECRDIETLKVDWFYENELVPMDDN